DAEWRKVIYQVFELPGGSGDFSHRLQILKQRLGALHIRYLHLVKQDRVASREALFDRLDQVVALGGEGLMLHRADALYHAGRSDDLLKLKRYQDAEATVIQQLPGKGKYAGLMGSLLVETEDGIRFRVGSGFSDATRRNPPPIGTVITYQYFGKSNKGIPRFASFLRVREIPLLPD
ncbi:MAG TPA: DNA ligase, partial [Gammaproteobacteria bacterium]|nr:DNA ligase [Gammaproteobacteria bacterium]